MSAAVAESKQSYFLDKLHSLSGIIPIGAFLAEHFFENSYALVSAEKYEWISQKLESVPWRVGVEALFIWVPILFHGFYGLYIWWSGKTNVWRHQHLANWMYVLQRWTGIIAFAYIFWHVYIERFATHGHNTYAQVAADLSNPWYFTFYVVGVLAASFHLGNGLWQFACKWGIALQPKAQRGFAYFGAAVGILFAAVGLAIVVGMHMRAFPLDTYVK
ncbi:MAG: succinate dehydrogenase [Candidatus Acidiferrales bacterium]